jgi:pimeloyl-ACP methyl ester carboxylesterase
MAFGRLTKRPVPAEVGDAWLRPFLTNRDIRRETAAFVRAIDKKELLAATERLRSFDRPVLLAWASEDRVFPPDYARRLAEVFPDARVEEIPDSYSFVPEDQPGPLAELVKSFVGAEQPRARAGSSG